MLTETHRVILPTDDLESTILEFLDYLNEYDIDLDMVVSYLGVVLTVMQERGVVETETWFKTHVFEYIHTDLSESNYFMGLAGYDIGLLEGVIDTLADFLELLFLRLLPILKNLNQQFPHPTGSISLNFQRWLGGDLAVIISFHSS